MQAIIALFAPFAYLRIRHPLKRTVDLWWSIFPSLIGMVGAAVWRGWNIFGHDGIIAGFNSLLQVLAGFFITSLAVIATFSGTAYKIDDYFEGEKALLFGEPLTRRQFLCHLFAYLALASIMLYLLGIIGATIATSDHSLLSSSRVILKVVFIALYFAAIGHLLGTTLIGLIFLSSRISRVSDRDRFRVEAKSQHDDLNAN